MKVGLGATVSFLCCNLVIMGGQVAEITPPLVGTDLRYLTILRPTMAGARALGCFIFS